MAAAHFTLDVHPDQVREARRQVRRTLEMLAERTPDVLATPDSLDGAWSGSAAVRVTGEMRSLGRQLEIAATLLRDADRSLQSLAHSYRDALADLPSLNRRWEEATSAYETAVAGANSAHTDRLSDIASEDGDDAEEAKERADERRERAVDRAHDALTDARSALTREYEDLRDDLGRATRRTSTDLRDAVLVRRPWIERILTRHVVDHTWGPRRWEDLARRRLADTLPLADEHRAAVAALEEKQEQLRAYGLEVPTGYDEARGQELVQELRTQLDALEGETAAARSRLINTWASQLDPADLSLLVMTDPELVGNLDGIPNRARYAANQANLAAAVAAEKAVLEEYWTPAPDNSHPQWAEYTRLVDRIATLERLQGPSSASGPHQVLAFEPPTYDGNRVVDDGRLAVVMGDLDNARFVGTVVPGITNRIDNFHATLEKAQNTQQLVDDSATIAWLGYDTPEFADASGTAKAEAGAQALKDFTDGLVRAEHSELTIMAHSYGTLVTSKALQLGMQPDRVVLFGSPGLGENITHKDDLGLPPDVPVYALRAPDDLVSISAGHGMDPVDMPGIIRLDTDWSGPEDVLGHSQYTDTDTDSLFNIAGVLAGWEVAPPGVQGENYLVTGGNPLADDGGLGTYNQNLRDLVDALQDEVPPEVLEDFLLHLEPLLQNTLSGGDPLSIEDTRTITELVRQAMDDSGIGDHLTPDELGRALIDADFHHLAGDLAGDWVRDQVDDFDALDGVTIPLPRGLSITIPDNASETVADGLGRLADGAVTSGSEWVAERLPDMDITLDATDWLTDRYIDARNVGEVISSIPEVVRKTPRIIRVNPFVGLGLP